MDRETKEATYKRVKGEVEAVLEGEHDRIAAMGTIACLLHQAFDTYHWTGFYRLVAPGELLIGPYQGTLGCQRIPFDRGVCGAAAPSRQTVIVPDVRQFPSHIACDPRSRSEIVVPVLDAGGELIGVLDVDSDQPATFDEVDRRWLEKIVEVFQRMQQRQCC